LFTADSAVTQYGPIEGFTTANHQAYIVKLGGVILTGGNQSGNGMKSYYITGGNYAESKVVLTSAPTTGYELEVRAISVGAAVSTLSGVLVAPIREAAKIDTNVVPAEADLDLGTQQVYLYPGNAATDFTLNLRNNGSNALSALLGEGHAISATVIVGMGAELKALTAVKIDGTTQASVKWQGSSKTLTASKLNIISLTVIKTGTSPAAYTVLGSVVTAGTV
jgi:hypothetical protein